MAISRFALLLCLSYTIIHPTICQNKQDISQVVMLKAEYPSTGAVHIFWDSLNEAPIDVSYRYEAEASWQRLEDSISIHDQPYVIPPGNWENGMEIRVIKNTDNRAFGFMQLGWEWEKPFQNRDLLIIIHESIADAIHLDLEAYRKALQQERWNIRTHINSDSTAIELKNTIVNIYNQRSIDAIILIGDIPVPLSGDRAIDGHNNHIGAWSSDSYYADLDGNWTDTQVIDTSAARERNHNIPADGKFDQRTIPSDVEIAVGRVDFSDMPAFNKSEVELTIEYLNKNIAYRTNKIKVPKRGMIQNRFGLAEGFGQSAMRSYSTIMHQDSIHYGNFEAVKEKSYLWSYGAGGGNYKGAGGIINTNQLTTDSIQTIFNALFGSYFGDYDVTDNLLRAAIGSGTTLVTSWCGRPLWEYHKMAMGETIGDILMQTQNDDFTYPNGFGRAGTHIALIGDPTLKQDYYPMLESAAIAQTEDDINMAWEAIQADNLMGYYVYYSLNNGPIIRLTETYISENTFSFCPIANGTYTIFISPVFLNLSPSGSFLDEGLSYTTSLGVDNIVQPRAEFDFNADGLEIQFENTSENAEAFEWFFGDGNSSSEANPTHVYESNGSYSIMLVAYNACLSDTLLLELDLALTYTNDLNASIHIFPNPTVDQLYIEQSSVQLPYKIYDKLGNKHLNGILKKGINILHTQGLIPGAYVIELGGEMYTFYKH